MTDQQSTQNTEQTVTTRTDRVSVRLSEHKAAITASRVDVHVRIPVPRVKLPPADDKVKRKIRMHLLCLLFGAILVGLCDLCLGDMFALHFGPFVQTGPNVAMEYLDRIRNR